MCSIDYHVGISRNFWKIGRKIKWKPLPGGRKRESGNGATVHLT